MQVDREETVVELPRLNSCDIDLVLRLRNKLSEILQFELEGQILTGRVFFRLVDLLLENLPISVWPPALEDSVRHLAGRPCSYELMRETCHRLAGNLVRLRHRRPVVPWDCQRHSEWVPVQVMSSRYSRIKTKTGSRTGHSFVFKILAGTSCPRTIVKFWSGRQCAFFAPRLGFSRPWRDKDDNPAPYPYSSARELVSLRFYALIEPSLSQSEPGFKHMGFPASVLEWNREKMQQRLRRLPGRACPVGYPNTFPCHRCHIGFDRCKAAVHRVTYVSKTCRSCGKEAFFDPEVSDAVCINCRDRAVFAGDQV